MLSFRENGCCANNVFKKVLVFLLLFLSFGCRQQKDLYVEDGTKIIDGIELYYKILGDGEPIVILHGGPGLDHSYFLPQMAELADDFQLIFFDQRLSGLSSSDIDSTAISMDHFVEDVEGIRKALNLQKMNLMGHSWGGLLAMFYAIKHPDNLKSLILVSPTAASVSLMMKSQQILSQRFTQEDRLQRMQIVQSEAFKNGEPSAFADLFRLSFKPSFYQRALLDSLTLELPSNFAANSAKLQLLFRDMGEYDIHSELSKIACRALIVHGDYDAIPLEAIDNIHQNIPNSEIVILENCGHFPFIETPEPFFEHIKKFMAKR